MTLRSCSLRVVLAMLAALLFPLSLANADGKTAQESAAKYDLSRIVSIGGDVTEILCELGLENNIVAIDTTSQFPEQALKTKPNIGYMRALSAEGVLSVKPSLILASKGAGPPEVVAALKATSIPYVEVSSEPKPEAVFDKVTVLARVTRKEDEGRALNDRIRSAFEKLALRAEDQKQKPRVLFVLLAQNGRALVGGKKTVADALFQISGLDNVASDIVGFRPINNEAALAMNPDVIITMRRAKEQTGKQAKAVTQIEGLRQTDAVKASRIIEIDGAYMLGFGPRLPQAALDLMDKVHNITGKS